MSERSGPVVGRRFEVQMGRDPKTLSVFMAHRGELLNYANRIVDDHAHAEDVVQEAYMRFDAATRTRLLSEPVSYLYRIVRNLALDGRRKSMRERRRIVFGADLVAQQIAEDKPSPEAELASKTDLKIVREAMAALPEQTRIALEMHRFGECTIKDIADFLQISVGSTHALIVDGLERCREDLRRAGRI